uniref:DUF1670 domain-containing protein n=2 Tax=Caenorhabditis tropicalis TaxID=1561998 RepID=A0A1I7TZ27_9PELO
MSKKCVEDSDDEYEEKLEDLDSDYNPESDEDVEDEEDEDTDEDMDEVVKEEKDCLKQDIKELRVVDAKEETAIERKARLAEIGVSFNGNGTESWPIREVIGMKESENGFLFTTVKADYTTSDEPLSNFLDGNNSSMDSNELARSDSTRPVQMGFLLLNGANSFNIPNTVAIAMDNENPPTTMEIVDEIAANLDCYDKMVRIMMRRGLFKNKQDCHRCHQTMTLLRKKNFYEWRCRSGLHPKDLRSVSIKEGSWFEHTKLPLRSIYNFLIMHIKKCSTGFIAEQLNLSNNMINDIRKTAHQITDRIQSRYPKIGKDKKEVLLEVITLKAKKTIGPVFHVFAGQEIGSSQCFAALLPDLSKWSLTVIKNQYTDPSAKLRMVKTSRTEESVVEGFNAQFFDELAVHENSSDRLFTNIRKKPDFDISQRSIHGWLNDLVVRKTEGSGLLEKFFEELQAYAD